MGALQATPTEPAELYIEVSFTDRINTFLFYFIISEDLKSKRLALEDYMVEKIQGMLVAVNE